MIVAGFFILVATSAVYLYKNSQGAKSPTKSDYSNQTFDSPSRIVIKKIGVDVPVKVAQNYQFSDREAIFIKTSQSIGSGNSVIYAHNWDKLFGKLKRAKVGDDIAIFLANGRQVDYQVSQIHTVPAETINILKETPDSRLTLFTCTGFLDKDRLVVVAKQI